MMTGPNMLGQTHVIQKLHQRLSSHLSIILDNLVLSENVDAVNLIQT